MTVSEPRVLVGSSTPRRRQGSPPSLLLNLFGGYWWEREESLPSAALVALLGDFGVTDVSARAALSRMQKHGLIAASRSGRNTAYVVTPRGTAVLRSGLRRLQEFGREPGPWDGSWRLITIGAIGERRSLRDALRARLRWLGYAALTDGVWVSPHDRQEAALAVLEELRITDATLLTAQVALEGAGTRDPRTAWDLSELADDYRSFIEAAGRLVASAEAGAMSTADALVERTRLGDRWFDLSRADPDLPSDLLPSDWPRARARAAFLAAHTALGGLAVLRVREVVSRVAPALGDLVTQHSITD